MLARNLESECMVLMLNLESECMVLMLTQALKTKQTPFFLENFRWRSQTLAGARFLSFSGAQSFPKNRPPEEPPLGADCGFFVVVFGVFSGCVSATEKNTGVFSGCAAGCVFLRCV